MEIFKDVPWWNWSYQVSNLWKVKSFKHNAKWRLLKYKPHLWWYKLVSFSENNKQTTFSIHRLVMLTFVWERPKWLDINHKNWIKHDNRLENLEYCTRSENELHSYKVLWKISHRKKSN